MEISESNEFYKLIVDDIKEYIDQIAIRCKSQASLNLADPRYLYAAIEKLYPACNPSKASEALN